MIVRAVKLRIATAAGDFGFSVPLSKSLTIIRGKNSSGKSTFFNTLLYSLGMEELVGGRGERALPYAVQDHFEYEGERLDVVMSEAMVELENSAGEVITIRRSIRDAARSTKLVEIATGPQLSYPRLTGRVTPTYLHDPGAAQKDEGFHRFLESFMGLDLPRVATTAGGEAKLYLQAVFAGLAVEQKRGWTDYMANMPFYGLREPRARVVEYLLGLDVFESSAIRNRLNAEASAIDAEWQRVASELKARAASVNIEVLGVHEKVSSSFDAINVRLVRPSESRPIPIHEYITQLRAEHSRLLVEIASGQKNGSEDAMRRADVAMGELQTLSSLRDQAVASLTLLRASLGESLTLLAEAQVDLERNKSVLKLRNLGASAGLEIANDRCPTCQQHVEDSLMLLVDPGPHMDVAANISYLDSQRSMLERQIAGYRRSIEEAELGVASISKQVTEKRDELNALRGDVSSGSVVSRGLARRQVQIDIEVQGIETVAVFADELIANLESLAKRLADNQAARKLLPMKGYSTGDEARIGLFEKMFRANAGSLGYESAPISDIRISRENLIPSLADLELRAIKTDIRADSSASDFVRLIQSYVLALYQASSHPSVKGNHPGVLFLDEPGQHSMAQSSQHALLQQLAAAPGLQSVVAASFDESDSVFRQATEGVSFDLVEWEGRLIRPLA